MKILHIDTEKGWKGGEQQHDWHTHPFDEVRWVLKGEITIGTEDEVITLKAGDRLNVPAGARHWAKVGDEGVVYICGSKRERNGD